jgi:dihydroorotate dehydrogenase
VVDGYGTCQIPGGTYPVLRQKRTDYTTTALDVLVPFLGWVDLSTIIGGGGFSGKIVSELSDILISKVYKYFKGQKIIIGCGGVFTAQDAYKKIKLGASLIQLITGMIYQGPQSIAEINIGLVKLLQKDGFKKISQAVGMDSKL